MDKVEKQKVQSFLISLDQKLKAVKDFLQLDRGDLLLEEVAKFEEENAEFLRFNSVYQEELNKRKWIIQYLIFPILSDDKVAELLQYHLLEAIEVGLDLEELMKMRAITISELLWPKISQEYLKALSQNTQLIGSDPLLIEREKSSYLPYIKNWISVYNRRFGIDKHTGLEPHQFVLENPNAQHLGKGLKENLLKVLKLYESLKVFSLSEIEGELRKMQMGAVAQQAVAYSYSVSKNAGVAQSVSQPTILDKRIKIAQAKYQPKQSVTTLKPEPAKPSPADSKEVKVVSAAPVKNQRKEVNEKEKPSEKEVVVLPIMELLDKYPSLANYKITEKSISLPTAPFNLIPTALNWIDYYHKECGKGRHSPQEREVFIERLKTNQGLGPTDSLKLAKLFRSVDDKTALPYDQKNEELLLDSVKVGETLKNKEEKSEESKISEELDKIIPKSLPANKLKPALRHRLRQDEPVKKITPVKKEAGYLEIELVPGSKNDESRI